MQYLFSAAGIPSIACDDSVAIVNQLFKLTFEPTRVHSFRVRVTVPCYGTDYHIADCQNVEKMGEPLWL
jgi:hypothetical protein